MKNNHFWDVFEVATSRAGATPPLHVFGEEDSCKWPGFMEIISPHDKIPGSGISVTLNVQLLPVVKDAFIRFDRGIVRFILTPNRDLAAEYGTVRCRAKRTESHGEPIGVRATIGIYKAENIAIRASGPPISRGTRPGA